MIARHAAANGVPESLVRRVIVRESGYNPRAVSAGNYGLMQIRLGTARSLGYRGSAEGLLDAETNMTYAVRYLAGAYQAAGGNESRAVALYASGYGNRPSRRDWYHVSWHHGSSHRAHRHSRSESAGSEPAEKTSLASSLLSLFGSQPESRHGRRHRRHAI